MKPLIKKILLWGLAIDLAIVLVVLIVNLPTFDEKLDSQLQRQLAKSSELRVHNNAFILMVGFDAPATDDHWQTALTLTRAKYEATYHGPNPEENNAWDKVRELDKEWMNSIPQLLCVSRKDATCIRQLAKALESIDIDSRQTLLQTRYQDLIRMQDIDESAIQSWQAGLPNYRLIAAIANVARANKLQVGNTQNLLAFIKQDVEFWRMNLRRSQLLVGKMVAASQLASSALLVGDLLQDEQLSHEQLETLKSSFSGLSQSEVDNSEVVLAEHRVAQRLSLYIIDAYIDGPNQNTVKRLFSQSKATQNDYFQFVTQPILKIVALESPRYINALKHFSVTYDAYGLTPAMIYNPVGKYLTSQSIKAQQEHFDYSARVRDLDGIFKLLNIQILVSQGAAVSQALQNKQYYNPYFLVPMSYSEIKNRIYFECLSKNFFECALAL